MSTSSRAGRLILAITVVMLHGCTQIEEIEMEGGPSVPPAVQMAFDQSCNVPGCHDPGTRAGGLSLAAGDSAEIIGGPAQQAPSLSLVEIGNVCGSYLAIKMLPEDQVAECGVARTGTRMPLLGIDEPETQEDVALILGWIAGAELPGGEGPGTGTTGTGSGTTDSGATGSGS